MPPDHLLRATAVDDVEFLVIDVETTGLSPDAGDRVCEIAAIKLRGGAVVETFTTLIDPQRPMPAGAFAVHGISPAMLAGAPAFGDVAVRLEEMMHDAVLVAYNAPFDMSFLTSELLLAGRRRPENTVVDALAMARQLLPGLARYAQENVAHAVGIPFPVRHRALEDSMVTGRLFVMFTSVLKAYGYATVADLQRRDLTRLLNEHRIRTLTAAIAGSRRIWIRYLSPTGPEITERYISPRECTEATSGRERSTYLLGYCHASRADRTFRVDRILDLRLLDNDAV